MLIVKAFHRWLDDVIVHNNHHPSHPETHYLVVLDTIISKDHAASRLLTTTTIGGGNETPFNFAWAMAIQRHQGHGEKLLAKAKDTPGSKQVMQARALETFYPQYIPNPTRAHLVERNKTIAANDDSLTGVTRKAAQMVALMEAKEAEARRRHSDCSDDDKMINLLTNPSNSRQLQLFERMINMSRLPNNKSQPHLRMPATGQWFVTVHNALSTLCVPGAILISLHT
jgi:hypothetical protein